MASASGAGAGAIQLYHSVGARSFRALWALEELQLAYTLHLVEFPPRFRQPGYLELNPLGTVPLLIDGESRMTESAAILHYLATRYGAGALAVAPDAPDYAAYLNFLVMGEATLTFPQTIVLRYGRLEPEERRLPQAVADYTRWFAVRLKAAAAWMGAEHACAGRFTAADISLGYAVQLAMALGLAEQVPDTMATYFHALTQRPGYRAAQRAEGGAALDLG